MWPLMSSCTLLHTKMDFWVNGLLCLVIINTIVLHLPKYLWELFPFCFNLLFLSFYKTLACLGLLSFSVSTDLHRLFCFQWKSVLKLVSFHTIYSSGHSFQERGHEMSTSRNDLEYSSWGHHPHWLTCYIYTWVILVYVLSQAYTSDSVSQKENWFCTLMAFIVLTNVPLRYHSFSLM